MRHRFSLLFLCRLSYAHRGQRKRSLPPFYGHHHLPRFVKLWCSVCVVDRHGVAVALPVKRVDQVKLEENKRGEIKREVTESCTDERLSLSVGYFESARSAFHWRGPRPMLPTARPYANAFRRLPLFSRPAPHTAAVHRPKKNTSQKSASLSLLRTRLNNNTR